MAMRRMTYGRLRAIEGDVRRGLERLTRGTIALNRAQRDLETLGLDPESPRLIDEEEQATLTAVVRRAREALWRLERRRVTSEVVVDDGLEA